MPRRAEITPRPVTADPIYDSQLVTQLMNSVMLDGKKSVAELIVYGAFETVEQRAKREPVGVFHDALNNVKPGIEVRSRRVGGATYQVPVEVPARRARTLAVRWLVEFARARGEKSMAERLANEPELDEELLRSLRRLSGDGRDELT